jgi:hypothetical protein
MLYRPCTRGVHILSLETEAQVSMAKVQAPMLDRPSIRSVQDRIATLEKMDDFIDEPHTVPTIEDDATCIHTIEDHTIKEQMLDTKLTNDEKLREESCRREGVDLDLDGALSIRGNIVHFTVDLKFTNLPAEGPPDVAGWSVSLPAEVFLNAKSLSSPP